MIGRLAIDTRAQGRRLGEARLLDALARVVDAAGIVGCTGIIVDAKDAGAERFYAKYDFVTVSAGPGLIACSSRSRPRRKLSPRSRS